MYYYHQFPLYWMIDQIELYLTCEYGCYIYFIRNARLKSIGSFEWYLPSRDLYVITFDVGIEELLFSMATKHCNTFITGVSTLGESNKFERIRNLYTLWLTFWIFWYITKIDMVYSVFSSLEYLYSAFFFISTQPEVTVAIRLFSRLFH